MTSRKCGCGSEIEEERLEVLPDTLVCCACAKEGYNQPPKTKGFMVYDHKTGGTLCEVPESTYELYKQTFDRKGQQSVLRKVSPSND